VSVPDPVPCESTAGSLRERMVATPVEDDHVRSPEVVAALPTVPRHLVDGVAPQRVYDLHQAVVTGTGADGVDLSSVSGTQIQAVQLEQAVLCPGHRYRVLEVGSGGVDAAYLAELVAAEGLVVTGDAESGVPGSAPFDRIVVTVETTGVPAAWWDQPTADGRIVAPVRWRDLSRSVALERRGEDLSIAEDLAWCGFVPVQGPGEDRQQFVVLHDVQNSRVALRVEAGFEADGAGLSTALLDEGTTLWSVTMLDTVVMTAGPGAQQAGPVPSASTVGGPVLVDGKSTAYRTSRSPDDPQRRKGDRGEDRGAPGLPQLTSPDAVPPP
jgi:protein-L-isoaspartate(D-aspartate) O-methyltransferase